jgi:hypothetical protein
MGQDVVSFQGPFALRESGPSWLFSREALSLHGGVYIFAWRYKARYFPHYIGQTSGLIVGRIAVHLRAYLAGEYWLYSPAALVEGCQSGIRPPGDEFYICPPHHPERHLEALRSGALSDYLSGLSFFLAELRPEQRLPVERALTVRAWEASMIMDSPKDNGVVAADVALRFRHGLEVVGLT